MPSPIFVLACAFFAAACVVAAIGLAVRLAQLVRIGLYSFRRASARTVLD